MTAWMEPFAFWLADVYLAATILLEVAAALFALVRQPSRRMAVAWGLVPGLLLAACLCLSASRPHFGLWPAPPVKTNTTAQNLVTSRRLYAGGLQLRAQRSSKTAGVKPAARRNDSTRPFSEADSGPFDQPDRMRFERFERQSVAVEPAAPIVSLPSVAPVDAPGRPVWTSRLVAVLVGAFLAGSLLVASRLALGVWRASRLVRESEPAPQACADELRALIGAPSRSPRLRVNRRLLTPVATGAVRPAILLPAESSRGGEPHILRAVLAHEWTHIKNGDLWLLAFDRIVLSLLWAHPLYWWTRRRIRADQEFLADAAAAAQIGSADYAALLVQWARKVTEQRSLAALTAVGIWERPAGLTERVTALLAGSESAHVRMSGRTRVGVAALLALLSLFAATISLRPPQTELARAEEIEPPKSPQLAEAPKIVNERVAHDEIIGTCVDEKKAPVRGAKVLLIRTNWQEMTQQLVGQTSTDEAGRFKFTPALAGRARKDNLVVVVRREGLATLAASARRVGKSLHFVMPPAATLKGTVRDAAGKPVAGALVDFRLFGSFVPPIEGVHCARTDAKGEFAVTDLEEFKYKRSVPPRNWHSGWMSMGPPSMTIVHPGYARTRVKYFEVPGDVDVVLADLAGTIEGQVVLEGSGNPAAGVTVAFKCDRRNEIVREAAQTGPDGRYRVTSLPEGSYSVWVGSSPTGQTAPVIESLAVHPGRTVQAPVMRLVKAGVIEGRIADDITGKHGAGITVDLQGVYEQKGKASSYFDRTVTDGNGHYRFASLPGGKFNLFIENEHLDAAAAAIDSFELKAGQTATAPPIRLVHGCLIKGRIIDDATGKAVSLREGDYLDIQSHGPARPRSGAAVQVVEIRKDGTFDIRLPPGDSWLGVRGGNSFEITREGGGQYSLADGDKIDVEYHVRRYDPSKESATKPSAEQEPLAEHELYSTKITDYYIGKDEIGGMCLSGDEARLAGVEVTLYIRSFGGQAHNWGAKQIDKTTTNDEGQFVFRHVPQVDPRDADYLTVARRHGRITMFGTLDHRHDWLDLRMPAARPFKGTVKNEQGKPVAGALVRCDGSPFYDLPEGIQSARTNARGEFEIDDVGGAGRCVVEHPDYARKTVEHLPFDEPAELKVRPGGVVEGQVVDTVTGKPASGLSVSIQPINQVPQLKLDDVSFFWASTKTDSQGLFRIESIPSGQFNVFVSSAPGRASVALDSLAVPAGEVVQTPPIRLVKPGVVKGRLIDELTGQPAPVSDDERVTIGVHGPSRPRSGAAIEAFAVKTDGTFELRLPPGKNDVYVAGGPFLVRKPGDPSANQDIRQIDVKEGTETTIEFRVIRQVPMKQAPEKTIKTPPAPTSGAVNRPEPVMLAEAPTVSPKIVDDHLEQDTVGGLCRGRDGARIAGAEVSLYIIHHVQNEDRTHEFIGRTITNDEGQFVFPHVPQVKLGDEKYEFIARRRGYATTRGFESRHRRVDLKLPPAIDVKGIVEDEQGQPIADAQIRVNWNREHDLPEGTFVSRTNARGEFGIDDAPEWAGFIVYHADYLSDAFRTNDQPGRRARILHSPVEITLKKASLLTGEVVDGETGQPLPGALVTLQRLAYFGERGGGRGSRGLTMTTDLKGRYKFGSLRPDTFNLSFRSGPGGVTSANIDALSVGQAQTVEVPPVRLAKGAIVAVRLIDNLRGRPVSMDADDTVVIGIRSAQGSTGAFAKPRLETLHMRRDGTIGVWLPTGKHAISLSGGPYFSVGDAAQGKGHDVREIEIKGGEEPAVEFRVVQIAHRKLRTASLPRD